MTRGDGAALCSHADAAGDWPVCPERGRATPGENPDGGGPCGDKPRAATAAADMGTNPGGTVAPGAGAIFMAWNAVGDVRPCGATIRKAAF